MEGNNTPTLLIDVNSKPNDLFRTVKQRIEACRAKCKCDDDNQPTDALPTHRLERLSRGRELPSYKRREVAASGGSEYGWMFCYEDFWFGVDSYSAFPCGCENYAGDPTAPDIETGAGDGHNDCGADWQDQITGYYFTNEDGLTGIEKFALSAYPDTMRNGKNDVHYWCSTPITNPAAGNGGYKVADCAGARDWGGRGANHRRWEFYIQGTNNSLGFYEKTDSVSHKVQDKMIWHNQISQRAQNSNYYSTFGSRKMTGATIGNETLVESPPGRDKDYLDEGYSYSFGSAVEYIGRTVTNINSGGSTNPQYYVFTTGGEDRDGRYSPTQKRVFTIGDQVRLAVDSSIQPGPYPSEGTDWVGTIVGLGYGTFNMDVCGEKLCNGVCAAAYIRGDVPGEGCPDIGPPPDCSKYAADEWEGDNVWPNSKSTPDELLPPSEWPVIDPNAITPNTSCNPNFYTCTGFRYTVEYSKKIPQRLGGGPIGSGTGPLNFHSYPGGAMYHAFKTGGIESAPKHKTIWSGISNTTLDQWIVKDGNGTSYPGMASLAGEINHWQSEPGGMVEWGGHGGKMYFTLENEEVRYTTDANNQQDDPYGGFANYSSGAPYLHIENLYQFPAKGSILGANGVVGNEQGFAHGGPFAQGETTRNSYNWDRSRCGAPDINWRCVFYEFDCVSGKITRSTDVHEELILCNCDMSYGQIPWYEYTGKAAPDWWPWKQAWIQGIEGIWECNETNTTAYYLQRGKKDYDTGAWIPGVVYSWSVDSKMLSAGNYQGFVDACDFSKQNAATLNSVTIPGDEETWPEALAWDEVTPQPRPEKWGYWYYNNHWVPPK